MASIEKRKYEKRERAKREAETRLRITEATMELHRTVGPARTTVTEVAQRAGVGRMTVYNHFPTDGELIEACSSHWMSLNPLPDPAGWADVADPERRLGTALDELYAWYRGAEDMMGKVLRDAPIVPALGELMDERWWALVDSMVETLLAGRGLRGRRRVRVEGALRVALDLSTWHILARAGLDDDEAAKIAAGLVAAA